MTTVYITRHGETLWNTRNIMQGWQDSPLTDKGIEQAMRLGERMKDIHLDKIYSSSCGRAFKTAEIVRGSRAIELIPRDNLREISLGDWEGREEELLREEYGETYDNFWSYPERYVAVSGESFEQVRERVVKELKDIVKANEGKTILIVTHAVALKSIMGFYAGTPINKLWEPPFIYQTSLSKLEFEGDSVTILMYGDDSHLKIKAV